MTAKVVPEIPQLTPERRLLGLLPADYQSLVRMKLRHRLGVDKFELEEMFDGKFNDPEDQRLFRWLLLQFVDEYLDRINHQFEELTAIIQEHLEDETKFVGDE